MGLRKQKTLKHEAFLKPGCHMNSKSLNVKTEKAK